MSQGVPGVPPPKSLLDALAAASSDPTSCGYVPNAGEPVLRRAVVEEIKYVYGEDADVREEDVSITAGCNLAFVAAITTVAGAGDEVILPVPWCVLGHLVLSSVDTILGTSITSKRIPYDCGLSGIDHSPAG